MTRLETRRYILEELESCLKERLLADEDTDSLNDSHLQYLSNPRERMFHVQELLQELNIGEAPGKIAYDILAKYLNKEAIDYNVYPVKLVQLVMGFLHTDRLPCERTIFSFWNYSPFTALRNAPPLPDEDWVPNDEPKAAEDINITIHVSPISMSILGMFVTIWLAMVVSSTGLCHKST